MVFKTEESGKNKTPNLFDVRAIQDGTKSQNFLSTWVYKDDDLCFVVDPGPASVINSLTQTLNSLSVGELDLNYILLTHIHIDHAGGVGKLLSFFPQAQVICHQRGIKHLINPEKLWEGSVKVLGKVVEMYGKILPVPEDKIQFQESVADGKIKVIETLGHAPHHQSFLFNNYLFAGEAAGVHVKSEDYFHIRPATPPIFNYDNWISSIRILLKENLADYKICYSHFGMRDNADMMIKSAQEQLSMWVQVITELFELRTRDNFKDILFATLEKRDKFLSNFVYIDKSLKKRERFYAENSIKGIIGYIQKKKLEME